MNLKHPLIPALVLILVSTAPLAGQNRRPTAVNLEDLPRNPMDTIQTEDPATKIIIFTNNTWEYYRPGGNPLDDLEVYREHWDTTQVFSYKSIELADLPPIVDLNLIKSLDEFKSPIRGNVYSKYGVRGRRNHNGVDIPLKMGEPIYAAFDGKVRYAQFNNGGFGNLVILRHPNGLETWSAHLSKLNVEVGDYVKAGQVIGFGGNTGRSRGLHLHFEMRYCDQTFDPEFIIDFPTGQLKYQTFALEKSFFNIRSRASEILEEDEDWDFPLLTDNESGEEVDILERIAQAQKGTTANNTRESLNQGTAVFHTVKSGDMLGKLAIQYGVSINQICQLNGITRTTILSLGRRLRIR